MKQFSVLLVVFLSIITFSLSAQRTISRQAIRMPDIPGYQTLKCDFHIHTVFSDGMVWPTVRVDEAWKEGLDVIAITDHIEVQPHKEDIPTNHNRSHEVAKQHAKEHNILLVKGTEITRKLPPGHFNAIFIENADSIDREDFMTAVESAVNQGAFIMWNHPGWPTKETKWFKIHSELYEKGWLHGIEVVNWDTYYPNAFSWCLDKDLSILSNSDIHTTVSFFKEITDNQNYRKPITLVFAKERTLASVKEALFAKRSAAWFRDQLFGKAEFLYPLLQAAIEIHPPHITTDKKLVFELQNYSDVPFELELSLVPDGIKLPRELFLPGNASVLLNVGKLDDYPSISDEDFAYRVRNVFTQVKQALEIKLSYSKTNKRIVIEDQ